MKLCTLILGLTLTHCAFASNYICYSHDNGTVPEFHASIEQSSIILSKYFKPFDTLRVQGIANEQIVDLDVIDDSDSVVGKLTVTANGAQHRFSGEFQMKKFSKNKRFFISCMSKETK